MDIEIKTTRRQKQKKKNQGKKLTIRKCPSCKKETRKLNDQCVARAQKKTKFDE
jgi:hypothetical protein